MPIRRYIIIDKKDDVYLKIEADEDIRNLIKDINPITTKLFNDIYLNDKLFDKIKAVYSNKDQYKEDDARLLDEVYNGFLRSGADLNDESKKKYREISERLAILSPKFSNNVLQATNEITLTNLSWASGHPYISYYYDITFALYINGNGGFVGNYLNQSFLNNLINNY